TLLPATGGGWLYTTGDDKVEKYDANGRLISVWDKNELLQTLTYDSSGRISQIIDAHGRSLTFSYTGSIQSFIGGTVTISKPDGGSYTYAVDGAGNLNTVTYPDTHFRTYLYGNIVFPNSVTEIIDENGSSYEKVDYDSAGRAQDS